MEVLPKPAIGHSHGKIILMGEHSVVYGKPAIALPFSAVKIIATTSYNKGIVTISSDYHNGPLLEGPSTIDNIKTLVKAICNDLNEPFCNFHIAIESEIPAERGLGSSAAVAGAIVRSLFTYFNTPLSDETLFKYMDKSEAIAHGNASGLDVRTTSGNSPVYYKRDEELVRIPVNLNAYLVVGDTGEKGDTQSAVGDVKKLLKNLPQKGKKAICKLGTLAEKTKQALLQNNLEELGKYMTDAHHSLVELTVSNTQLDDLVEAALEAGALGAKLTGGGRGGCMIALAEDEEKALQIKRAIEDAGAVHSWIYSLEKGD